MRQCHACHQPFPSADTNTPQSGEAQALLRLQVQVKKALNTGKVQWGGVTLSREDFMGLLHSLILLSIPDDAPDPEPTRRFERLSVQDRGRVLINVAEFLDVDLATCLWRLRERAVRSAQLCRKECAVSEWMRHLLGFALDGQKTGALPGSRLYLTDAVWRRCLAAGAGVVLAQMQWPESQLRLHLQEWLNCNMLGGTRRTWQGTVHYLQLQTGIERLLEAPSCAGLITALAQQPECAEALTSPKTVRFLLDHQHPDAQQLWRQMVTRRLHALIPYNTSV
ncbi:hypothetical protein [Deinococcus marmoris]|uniref:hypothetical protein n=1 Tax=Deinococcus marmoris TaxID=249408 RepID=UPI000494E38B|nr:hypothetical protein [Deinococcus marmoris]